MRTAPEAIDALAKYDAAVRKHVTPLWRDDFDALLWDSCYKSHQANAKSLKNNLYNMAAVTRAFMQRHHLNRYEEFSNMAAVHFAEKIMALSIEDYVKTFGVHLPPTVLFAIVYESVFNFKDGLFVRSEISTPALMKAIFDGGLWDEDRKDVESGVLSVVDERLKELLDYNAPTSRVKFKRTRVSQDYEMELFAESYAVCAVTWNMFKMGVDVTAAMAYANVRAVTKKSHTTPTWDFSAFGKDTTRLSTNESSRNHIVYSLTSLFNDASVDYANTSELRGLASRFDFTLLPAMHKFATMPASSHVFLAPETRTETGTEKWSTAEGRFDIESMVARVPQRFSPQKFYHAYCVMDFHRKFSISQNHQMKASVVEYPMMSHTFASLKSLPGVENIHQVLEESPITSQDTTMRRYSNVMSVYKTAEYIVNNDGSLGLLATFLVALALGKNPSSLRPVTRDGLARRRDYSLSFDGAVASVVHSVAMNCTDEMFDDLVSYDRDELAAWAQEFVDEKTVTLCGVVPTVFAQGDSHLLHAALYEMLGRSMDDFLSFISDVYCTKGMLSVPGVVYYTALKHMDEDTYTTYMDFMTTGFSPNVMGSISTVFKQSRQRSTALSFYENHDILPGDVVAAKEEPDQVRIVMEAATLKSFCYVNAVVGVRDENGKVVQAVNPVDAVKQGAPFVIEPMNHQAVVNNPMPLSSGVSRMRDTHVAEVLGV